MPFGSSSFLLSRRLSLHLRPPAFARLMSGRSYADAIERLNSLQSNAATLDAVRASGGRLNEYAIPEMVEYLERIGYKVCSLANWHSRRPTMRVDYRPEQTQCYTCHWHEGQGLDLCIPQLHSHYTEARGEVWYDTFPVYWNLSDDWSRTIHVPSSCCRAGTNPSKRAASV
jgi:hypothetical protein